MEDVFDVYELPYDPMFPVVCIDEKPYQLFKRNTMAAKVDWQFKTSDVRIKLSSLYPKFTATSM